MYILFSVDEHDFFEQLTDYVTRIDNKSTQFHYWFQIRELIEKL